MQTIPNLVEVLETSPLHSSFTQTVSLEGKKVDEDNRDLQVVHNAILCGISQFTRQCEAKMITREQIIDMKELSAYCIAYIGSGFFGFYKIVINFKMGSKLVTKHNGAVHKRPVAAALVDKSLDYFFNKFRQS